MLTQTIISVAGGTLAVLLLLRTILSLKSLTYALAKIWRFLDDHTQAHQNFNIPRYTSNGQENPLYRKASAYVASLSSLEDATSASVFSTGRKSNDFYLGMGISDCVTDRFLKCRLAWSNGGDDMLVLRVRRQDRTRVLRPYLQHVETVADELELRRKDICLYTSDGKGRWRGVAFTHPATFDTIAVDQELKTRVRAELEAFLKGRAYYARLGRVWRRSYLLHGPAGTGKSTFVAAMAKFLCYDIYNIDLTRLSGDDDLKELLLSTTPRSLILVEDLDRYLKIGGDDGERRVAGMLNFMDGIFSCCGEERVMVFTMTTSGNEGIEGIEPAILRPGRLDVHIFFPLCDFSAFKMMASSYLGLTDHKLYPQVEEVFQSGGKISPAEVGEIMIANRGSPSRALKTVINVMQKSSKGTWRRFSGEQKVLIDTASMGFQSGELIGANTKPCELKNGGIGSPRFGKLYGLIKMRSRKDGGMSVEAAAAAAAVSTAAATTANSGAFDNS